MRKNGLHRMYNRLEADERFRLDVLAMARGDTQESERLTRTCPRFNYTMNDRAYVGRWTGTYEITLRMYIALNNVLAKLQMVDAFREVVPYSGTLMHNAAFDAYFDGHRSGSYHAWNHAGKTGRPPAWPDDDLEPDEDERDAAMERDMEELDAKVDKYGELLPELMDRIERDLTTEAFSLWEGFCAFCEESMGVAAEKVATVVLAPDVDRIEDLKSRAERLETEADAETVEQIREGLAETWRMVEERGI
jgi:hypothetical protein